MKNSLLFIATILIIGCGPTKPKVRYIISSNQWANQQASTKIDKGDTIILDLTSYILDGSIPLEAYYKGMKTENGILENRFESRLRITFNKKTDSIADFPFELKDDEIVIKYRTFKKGYKGYVKATGLPE